MLPEGGLPPGFCQAAMTRKGASNEEMTIKAKEAAEDGLSLDFKSPINESVRPWQKRLKLFSLEMKILFLPILAFPLLMGMLFAKWLLLSIDRQAVLQSYFPIGHVYDFLDRFRPDLAIALQIKANQLFAPIAQRRIVRIFAQ